jgi:H+/Cl- antiporter ClcA
MIAAGAGVGIAVTFGAPIGGVLFAYEISRTAAYWTVGTFFRTFVGTTVGVYFYTLLWQI